MGSKKGMLETIADYTDHTYRRDTANTLEQIRINQELEQARKAKDKRAEAAALQKKALVQKQVDFSHSLDGVFYGFALLLMLGFGYFVLRFIIIPVFFGS